MVKKITTILILLCVLAMVGFGIYKMSPTKTLQQSKTVSGSNY